MWKQLVLRLNDVHICDTWTINTDKQLTDPCVCNYTSGHKNMRKVVQCIPLKTMAALAVLEDIANGAIWRERVFRDREDLLAHDGNWLISCFRFPNPKGNPPGIMCSAAAGVDSTQRPTNRDCASWPWAEPCQPSGTKLSKRSWLQASSVRSLRPLSGPYLHSQARKCKGYISK